MTLTAEDRQAIERIFHSCGPTWRECAATLALHFKREAYAEGWRAAREAAAKVCERNAAIWGASSMKAGSAAATCARQTIALPDPSEQ